jgi:hypothetical protein
VEVDDIPMLFMGIIFEKDRPRLFFPRQQNDSE